MRKQFNRVKIFTIYQLPNDSYNQKFASIKLYS